MSRDQGNPKPEEGEARDHTVQGGRLGAKRVPRMIPRVPNSKPRTQNLKMCHEPQLPFKNYQPAFCILWGKVCKVQSSELWVIEECVEVAYAEGSLSGIAQEDPDQ